MPQAYLRAFCTSPVDSQQIYTYDLSEGRAFKAAIKNVAVMRHFYTLGLGQGTPSYAIENALSRLESDVKPILGQMIETESMNLKVAQRNVFARFLATLTMRTRHGLQIILGQREEMLIKGNESAVQLPALFDETLASLDDNGMLEVFAQSVFLVGNKLAPFFDKMHWRIVRAIESHFITSENPIVICNPTEAYWGLGTPGTHIYLPLSPRLLLHITREPVVPGNGTVDAVAEGVSGFNGLTILGAENYLFSHTKFDEISDLIADRPSGFHRAFGPRRLSKFG